MSSKSSLQLKQKAIQAINQHGCLLVFPIKNQKEPLSLWQCLHPKTKMNWCWDEDGDNRVVDLWMLMKDLSQNREVVYSKWYQGRATFFSRELFTAILKLKMNNFKNLKATSKQILETLESDSPLSTKQLKSICELQGKDNQKYYDQALRELFREFLIVGFGEVEDGVFPSLAVGATQTLYEDLWVNAQELSNEKAKKIVDTYLKPEGLFRKFFEKYSTQQKEIS